ncbi:response regulator transcription factor [Paenibacillus sp. FJAT-27812]|uniref:response regulator transcription factor n=1 Tax=Paenibacillus sp. FJAT-27812 TaxID=1684143 RepID=UPI0006A783F9|nr:response regulator [Paenibacillus sp. FJAT-27812]
MKIIVIEDEMDILRGLHDTLEVLDRRIEHLITARSAEEAIKLIDQYRPDIIVTDIVLPEMTGLQMLELMEGMNGYNPKVLVISSYSDFHFAQRSIQLGASDYILKPVDKSGFGQKVVHMLDLIEEEKTTQQYVSEQVGLAKFGSRFLRDKFVLSLCLHKTTLQEHIFHQLRIWQLEWLTSSPYYVLSIKKNSEAQNDVEMELDHFSIGNIAEELLEKFPMSILFRNVRTQWTIITSYPDVHHLAEMIQEQIFCYQKYRVVLGVSDRMNAFQDMSSAFTQSLQACKLPLNDNNQEIIYYASLMHDTNEVHDYPALLSTCILAGDIKQMSNYIGVALNELAYMDEVRSFGELSAKAYQFILQVYADLSEKTDKQHHFSPIELWEEMDKLSSIADMKRYIYDFFLEKYLYFKEEEHIGEHFIVGKAKQIMVEKFNSALSLQLVADELKVHPVWLSHLFKRESGQNFLDYLTELRIDVAKKRLRNSNKKIYEITLEVGYHDSQHFGKLFKKRTGVTPREYRYSK